MQTLSMAQQIYQTSVKSLPIVERLKLVQLVLADLLNTPTIKALDESDAWTIEDYADLTRASLSYVAETLEEPTL